MQHIAAHEDVGIDAVAFELAGEPDMQRASGFQRLGGLGGFLLIARIGAADAGDLAAGGLEGGRAPAGLADGIPEPGSSRDIDGATSASRPPLTRPPSKRPS